MPKPILLDGGCGSLLWKFAEEAGIAKDLAWKYNLEHPELVEKLNKGYVDAGCDMIQTNTFTVNKAAISVVSDYAVSDIIKEAVAIAKDATKGTDVKVYLSSGPMAALLKPFGPLDGEECAHNYREVMEAAGKAGVDAIMLETFMDVQMMRIAAQEAIRIGVPVICSMTFFKRQRTMMGDTIEKIVNTLEPMGISGIGMNCSYGPVEAMEIIKSYRETTKLPLYLKPNAGTEETYDAVQFATELEPALDYVTYIGGCCGTDFDYIKELKRKNDARG